MIGLLSYLKYLPAFALGATLAIVPAYLTGKSAQREEARSAAALEALDRIETMEKNNAGFSKLSDRDRCLVFMRDSGLPEQTCDSR